MDIQRAIDVLSRYGHLDAEQAEAVMRQIMRGEATESQIGAYLMALRMKGETTEEITGSARAMRAAASKVPTTVEGDLLDTCGTGGDRSGSFNISTTVAFVAAGAAFPWPNMATARPAANAAAPMSWLSWASTWI